MIVFFGGCQDNDAGDRTFLGNNPGSFQSTAWHIDVQENDIRQEVAGQLNSLLHCPSLSHDFKILCPADDDRQAFAKQGMVVCNHNMDLIAHRCLPPPADRAAVTCVPLPIYSSPRKYPQALTRFIPASLEVSIESC
jgi:hypothetical protein